MRTLAVIGCLASLTVTIACAAFARFLERVDLYLPGLDISTILDGRLHLWFFSPLVWSQFPFTPRIGWVINLWAGVLMLVIACVVVYAARSRLRRSPAVAGLTCLLMGAIPYAVGALVLL